MHIHDLSVPTGVAMKEGIQREPNWLQLQKRFLNLPSAGLEIIDLVLLQLPSGRNLIIENLAGRGKETVLKISRHTSS